MDAGEGARWHIHFGHIKLGNDNNSRVNFNGRPRSAIRAELGEKITRYGLCVTGANEPSFRACIDFINARY